MSDHGKFVPPEPGGFVPPEPGGFVPPPEMLNPPGAAAAGAASAGPAPAAPADPTRRRVSRHNRDQLGIVWVRGALHLAALRQRKTLGTWSSPAPVRTVEEFAAALDTALVELKFEGSDTFLVFEGEQFVHQPESAPAFSAAATRHYLRGRIDRYVQEHGPVLWTAQPTASVKDERAFILHLLPREFYAQLRRVLTPRRLDLTRILPMVVPVLREMNGFPIPRGEPALVAAEAADATIIVVARAGGPLLFSRLILAAVEDAPTRVAVEINRSILYARQQYNVQVDRIWLATRTGRALEEVKAKCGAGKMVMVLPTRPEEWVQTAHRVARTQPVNLVARHLRRQRRVRFIRLGLIAAGWLALAALGFQAWRADARWRRERAGLDDLQARAPALAAERDRLQARNEAIARTDELRQRFAAERLPPVPGRLLAYLAGLLPPDARLTSFTVKWGETDGRWSFQCEGVAAGDDEAVHELIASLQQQLARGPLRVRCADPAEAFGRLPVATGALPADQQRFTLEGLLFEK